jgi:hypothetical protein
MIRLITLLTFFSLSYTVFAQNNPYPVYLIGNTATKSVPLENYTLLKQELDKETNPFTVVHLGDIALNNGWPEYPTQEQMVRLDQLIDLVKDNPKGKILFIPGDKDWNNSGKDGLKAVRRLEKYIQSKLPYKNGFVPGTGCPGPEIININPYLRIVAINSSWWMHPYDKPEVTDTDCKILTRQEFVEELEEAINESENRNVLVVGHHPLISNGVYGGYMTLKKHLFPFSDKNPKNRIPVPFFGSIYAAYRQNIGTPRDMANFRYVEFRDELFKIFKQNPGLVYASAHDYSLQLSQADETYHIVSGSIAEKEAVHKNPTALFNKSKTGFAKLEYYPNGEVNVYFYETKGASFNKLYSQMLYQSPCVDLPENLAPANRLFIPCPAPDSVAGNLNLEVKDGIVTQVAGPQYKANWLKKAFFGKLYRSTWTTPVQVPLLDLRRTYGGLKPVGRGGGRQTTSLQFQARNGQEFVFRSVDKDPVKALPLALRETFVTDVLREITATAQPYGALICSSLLDSTDILHARPALYVLPNDPAMGIYRAKYAGLFGMLEDRPVDPPKGEKGFANADDIVRTYGLFRKLYDDHDNRLDAYAFGKARAFDIWVGDFGKHDDNWRWAGYDQAGGERVYKPIPRDRDHAFSRWNGFFPWLADRSFVVKSVQNFGYDYQGLRSLNYPARHLDRALLQSLSRQDWQKIARELQAEMDEETIDKAIAAEPKEVVPVSGNEVGFKLKNRIKKLPQAIDEFYLDLALVADIVGSNKNEYFLVERKPEGSVRVREFEKHKETGGPEGEAYFDRTFYRNETEEIRIFGLDGKDVIEITGNVEKSILVRVIGGDGADIIRDNSSVKGWNHLTKVYDVPKTEMQLSEEAKNLTSNAVNINSYNRQEFQYNYQSYIPSVIYNRSDGLGAGLTLSFGRYLFREPEEKRVYNFNIRATNKGAFQLTGSTIWNNVLGSWSFGGSTSYGAYFPFYNFFGVGNNTVKNDDLYDADFYRSRYKGIKINGFTQTKFLRKSFFRIGPLYEQLNSSTQDGTILNEETVQQLITGRESLLGGNAELDFDLRDNENFSLRGLRFNLQHSTYQRLTREKNAFGLTEFYGQYFGTTRISIPITTVIKLGGAKNYGENLPFYKFTSLGLRDNLRGYVNNRFFGDGSAYLNSELRFHLGRVQTTVLPFYYGLVAFYDQGKVWYKGSDEGNWHRGYGTGFYIAPLEQRYALNVLFGFSEEETFLLQFSLGLVLDR